MRRGSRVNEQSQRRSGRPRDPEIHSKVLLAAQRVYVKGGRSGFTFEAIAREAAVGKPAIYRRWASVDDLLDDILSSHTLVPETRVQGSIRGELQEIAMATLRLAHSEQGAFILRLSSERGLQPKLYRQYFERLRNVIHFQNRALIVAAITRGELSTDCDPDVIIQAITGSVLVGTLMGFVPAPDEADAATRYCEHLVHQVLQGALPAHQPIPRAVHPSTVVS